MNHKMILAILLISTVLGEASKASAAWCGIDYPTRWNLENKSDRLLNVSCRIYQRSGGTVHQVDAVVGAGLNHTIVFDEYSDGLGMFYRDWSCSSSEHANPLMRPDSNGFEFRGCPDETMQLEHVPTNSESDPFESSLTAGEFCPEASSITRSYSCSHLDCSWDLYTAGAWRGTSRIMSPRVLSELRFVGADATSDGSEALGCVYYSKNSNTRLIMTAFDASQTEDTLRSKFKPADTMAFSKKSGHLSQCLKNDPKQCPMTYR